MLWNQVERRIHSLPEINLNYLINNLPERGGRNYCPSLLAKSAFFICANDLFLVCLAN
jgi:hypothetical protein